MCRPTKIPETTIAEEVKPASSSSTFLTKCSIVLVFIAVAFPCFISEVICGWTKQYTSPLLFPYGKLTIPPQNDKVVIVTGANTGIGYETALNLVHAGAHVIVACRSEAKAKNAMERIQKEVENDNSDAQPKMTFLPLDLSSLKSVKDFAKEFKRLKIPLHTLVLNAGVMKSPGAEFVGSQLTYGFDTTQDGLEYHIGVNHVAHFYLTKLLVDSIEAGGRVISVSSMAEQGAYEGTGMLFEDWIPTNGDMPSTYEDGKAYGQSKLANLLFAKEFAARYAERNITAYACHPGVITTDLSRYMTPVLEADAQTKPYLQRQLTMVLGKWFESSMMASPAGALTQLHLATADVTSLKNGAFYHPVGRPVTPTHPQGSNSTLQTILWEETERVIKKLTR